MEMDLRKEKGSGMQFCDSGILFPRGDPAKREIAGSSILMADDDPDDYFLVREALAKAGLQGNLRRVSDGDELLDYLQGSGRFSDDRPSRPSLILLDLNMPRKDGRQALQELKAHTDFKDIPVVVFTTSDDIDDITACCNAGADQYVTKPSNFESLVETMAALGKDWLGA